MSPAQAQAALEVGLSRFDCDLSTARVSEYRKLYHEGWRELLDQLVAPDDRQWLTDRYKALVF